MGDETVVYKNVAPGAELIIRHIGGDLIVESGTEGRIAAFGEEVRFEGKNDGSVVTLECDSDCRVRVPPDTSVTVDEVNGDARIVGLAASLVIRQVHSDLTIRDVNAEVSVDDVGSDARITDVNGPLAIDSVGSDLVVRDVNGPLAIDSVGSDLEVKRVNGPVAVDRIGSDAKIREIRGPLEVGPVGSDCVLGEIMGPCSVASVGSDLVLDTSYTPGLNYSIGSVGADVLAKARQGSQVRFIVPAGTEKSINMRGTRVESVDGEEVIVVGEADQNAATVSIESIGGEFQLASHGKMFSAEFEFNFPENLGEIISTRIAEQLARIQENLERQSERIQREAERARTRAEEIAQRARERAERHAERSKAKMKGPRASRTWTWSWGGDPEGSRPPSTPRPPAPPMPPVPPTPPVQPVTEQERMAILRMVEARQITVEEAERLLAALEGRG